MSEVERTHPSPTRIRHVVGMVREVLDGRCMLQGPKLDMRATKITEGGCGTVACVAGWFALTFAEYGMLKCMGRTRGTKFGFGEKPDTRLLRWTEPVGGEVYEGRPVEFADGVRAFRDFVGQGMPVIIERWASANPEIWGNMDGHNMWRTKHAYLTGGNRDARKVDLEHVLQHWEGVADRVEAAERREDA